MFSKACAWLILLLLALASVSGLFGQGVVGGSLTGIVTDAAAALVAGVEVTLTNDATGVKFTTKTNEVGSYTFANLNPGRYTLSTQMVGFAPVSLTGITVTVAQFARADVQMKLGTVNDRIEVTATAGVVETERIERDRSLESLEETCKKLEAQMKSSEIRAPMDGLLTSIQTIDGELVIEGNELLSVSSRKNYVRGEVNEEDVGEVKNGMQARVQLYAYRTQQFTARVSAVQPAADPETQRYTVVLQLENSPDNLMAGMTGEMNIITGTHENVLLVPTRALLVDQALVVKRGVVHARTVKVGFRTLDFAEALEGLSLGDRVIVADQDKMRPGHPVRTREVDLNGDTRTP